MDVARMDESFVPLRKRPVESVARHTAGERTTAAARKSELAKWNVYTDQCQQSYTVHRAC